jgi:hypothetical protein
VGLDELPADGEPESASAVLAAASGVEPGEALEDALSRLVGDAGTGVGDGQADLPALVPGRDRDL